jgi:hypothetical protein
MRDRFAVLRPQAWARQARETAADLRALRSSPPAATPAFTVTDKERSRVRFRWPSTYDVARAHMYVHPIRQALGSAVRLEVAEIPQPYAFAVVAHVDVGSGWRDIVIDYNDETYISEPAAERCSLYFKMRHLTDGYGRSNVVPGGYSLGKPRIYRWLPEARRLADREHRPHDVYGRFGASWGRGVRQRAMALLEDQQSFELLGGLTKVDAATFQREIAESKICIDLPGIGPFCFRLMNYFAVGSCVVGPPHGTTLQAPLVDRVHMAFCRPDMSDLVDLCVHYLDHPEEQAEMRRQSRQFYDAYLHPESLGQYYLRRCIDMVS